MYLYFVTVLIFANYTGSRIVRAKDVRNLMARTSGNVPITGTDMLLDPKNRAYMANDSKECRFLGLRPNRCAIRISGGGCRDGAERVVIRISGAISNSIALGGTSSGLGLDAARLGFKRG